MSGCSYDEKCINCDNEGVGYSETRPSYLTWFTCFDCGLEIHPTVKYMELDEINDHRQYQELEPLAKLPHQNKEVI